MKKSPDRRDAAALNWKPRLKNAAKRGRSLSTSGTSHEADRALATIRSIDSFVAGGGDAGDSYVTTLAGRRRMDSGTAGTSMPARAAAAPRSRRTLLCAGAAIACLLGVTMVASGALARVERHTVAGRVFLDKKPFGGSELRFHPTGFDAPLVSGTAAADGRFELTDVKQGAYRVTVHPPGGTASVTIAAGYTEPEKTPLRLTVTRRIDNVRLETFRKMPAPRKATWTPGID